MEVIICYIVMNMIKIAARLHLTNVTMVVVTVVCIVLYVQMRNEMRIYSEREANNMVRKINNRLYKINTYASAHIIEIDDNYDEEVQKLRKEIQLDSLGYKLNLLVYLATLTVQGYAILSVTEFNIDGSKPRVAYASSKDFKKIVKYYSKKKA